VDVFEYDDGRVFSAADLVKEAVEKGGPVSVAIVPAVAVDLPDDVVQRSQRTRCKQGVTGALVDAGGQPFFPAKGSDERCLADA